MQALDSQRGEGAYFRGNTVILKPESKYICTYQNVCTYKKGIHLATQVYGNTHT